MVNAPRVVALAGGVGGAKLAHGLAQILPPGNLTVIGNVGDDFEHYGLHISPDLDTVMYTLAGRANPKTGWGLVNESWQNLAMMQTYGEKTWFSLGDNDLATHILRTYWLRGGQRLTTVMQRLSQQLALEQQVLPVTDDRLRTMVDTHEHGILPFQVYFVKHRWQPTVKAVHYEGADISSLTPEARAVLETAELIIFCPSNPILSIAPILAVPELRERIQQRAIPSVLVSPLIGGQAVKGPTDKLMREMGLEPSVHGVARYYKALFDILVIDTQDEHERATLQQAFPAQRVMATPTLMTTDDDRRALAQRILKFIEKANE
jgi:LPPG:FO 2-phospho-L-lactate transferase